MSRTTKGQVILFGIIAVTLATVLLYDTVHEWLTIPRDPEKLIDSIVAGKPRWSRLFEDEFPIQVLFDHLDDERKMRPIQAVQGPYRVWMMCKMVLIHRLGLGHDLSLSMKSNLPYPDPLLDQVSMRSWWEHSSKDELALRYELASWQLVEMEMDPERFKANLDFKRKQVAETKRQLDAR